MERRRYQKKGNGLPGSFTYQCRRRACRKADKPSIMHRMAMVRLNHAAKPPNMPSAAINLEHPPNNPGHEDMRR